MATAASAATAATAAAAAPEATAATEAPEQLKAGDAVYNTRGRGGVITGEVEGGRGLRRYTLRYDDQEAGEEDDEQPESELRAQPPRPDSLAMLREARVGDARNFLLRR